MRSLRSSRLVLSAISALGLAGTRRRGGAGGIGAETSPGACRKKPPGPIERIWGCGGALGGLGSPDAGAAAAGAAGRSGGGAVGRGGGAGRGASARGSAG